MTAALKKLGFIMMSETGGKGLPLVAFRLDPAKKKQYDEFAIAHQLRERGWVVPAYTMAPHSEKMKLMRVVIREDFSRSRCEALLNDFKLALCTLDDMDSKRLEEHREHIKRHTIRAWQKHIVKSKLNDHYTDEEHSLQGKTGKTHAPC
jgi:glutamate decarboxylase